MRLNIALTSGLGGISGFLMYWLPHGRFDWYEYPNLWLFVGIAIGGAISVAQYRRSRTSPLALEGKQE